MDKGFGQTTVHQKRQQQDCLVRGHILEETEHSDPHLHQDIVQTEDKLEPGLVVQSLHTDILLKAVKQI